MNGNKYLPRAAIGLALCLAAGPAAAETRVDVSLSVLAAMLGDNPDSPADR